VRLHIHWFRPLPNDSGKHAKRCVFCGLLRAELPCWASTIIGHTDAVWRTKSDDGGETWTKAVKR
jgi:hypothetical protein